MPMSSSLSKRGSALWESGEKNKARNIFEIIVQNDSQNEAAWVWYVDTRETNREKIAALDRYLAIFPNDETARRALAELREEEESSARNGQSDLADEKKKELPPVALVPAQEMHTVERGWLQTLPWLLVVFGVCFLLISSFAFIAQYISLQGQVEKLEADRQSVSQNLAHLNTEYNSLQAEKNSLSDQYNSLIGQYESLNGQYSGLEGRYTDLNNNYSTLSEKYDSLSAEHVNLQSYVTDLETRYNETMNEFASYKKTAITPPYIYSCLQSS